MGVTGNADKELDLSDMHDMCSTNYNIHPTTHILQHTSYNIQRTTYNLRLTICNLQPVIYNLPIYNLQSTNIHSSFSNGLLHSISVFSHFCKCAMSMCRYDLMAPHLRAARFGLEMFKFCLCLSIPGVAVLEVDQGFAETGGAQQCCNHDPLHCVSSGRESGNAHRTIKTLARRVKSSLSLASSNIA
eukprot:757458-Hanusia_phi.AAC.1